MKLRIVVLCLSIAACSTTGQVQPIGKDTYLVSVHSCSGKLFFGADCEDLGVKAANQYCASRGLVATITATDQSGMAGFPKDGHVQFVCTDKQHQPAAVLRPDHGVTTNENR
jgi:hypothetical protein